MTLLLTLPGCRTPGRTTVAAGALTAQAVSPPVETYRRLAEQYEADQQLPRALLMWRVIEATNSGDGTVRERIAHLRQSMEKEGSLHCTKGREYLDQKSLQVARREFALALAYNPYGEEAANYLRKLSFGDEFVEYAVKAGDSPERIAQTVYHDGNKHSIVSYFGDTNNDRELSPGRILRLPAPDQEMKAKAVHLPKPYSANSEMPRMYDRPGAEAHYNMGLAHYLARRFPEAISEWEEVLRLDPDYPNAKRDLRKARAMLRKTRLK